MAAGKELTKAGDYATRHIILFADANDSEEPGDYRKLLKQYADAGITVSVIGLGTKADHDAKLLEEIATLGGGSIMFSNDPLELPRLFTQDTMSIARNTFIKKDDSQPQGIPGLLLPESRLMGELGSGPFPNVDGYNLCYIKSEATQAAVSTDEYHAPLSAFWYRGLGRAAALTLEVDGKYSGQFGHWSKANEFLVTHVRWLLGNARPDDLFVKIDRAGQDAVATVELDPDRPDKSRRGPPTLVVVPPGAEREAAFSPDFIWTGPDSLEARFRMDRTGTYRTLVKTGERKFVRGPAVTLPYSPEFVPRVGMPSGLDTLKQVAEVSGGKLRTDVLEVLADPPRSATSISLIPWLMALGIGLLLVEIGGRRLDLWERAAALVSREADEDLVASVPSSRRKKWWSGRLAGRRAARQAAAATAEAQPSPMPAPEARSEPAKPDIDVFRQAKERAPADAHPNHCSEVRGRNGDGPSAWDLYDLGLFRCQALCRPRKWSSSTKKEPAIHLKSDPSRFAFQSCIAPGCGEQYAVDETRLACGKCGGLLDVSYEWDRVPVPSSLREFEARWSNRRNPLDFSGVWRFRELLPFAPPEAIVTIGEGQTILQQFRQRSAATSA